MQFHSFLRPGRSRHQLSLLFSFAFFLLSGSLSAQWVSAHPGMKWRAYGTGNTTGKVITLQVYNPTPDPLDTRIGPFFIPGGNGRQGYVVNDTYQVTVPAFSTGTVELSGYCTHIFDLPVAAGDAPPAPLEWVNMQMSAPAPGPGWSGPTGGFQAIPAPAGDAVVLTYPGTREAFLYRIDINEHPATIASTLIGAVNALADAFDRLVASGAIDPAALPGDAGTKRQAAVQQIFWYYTSLLGGTGYNPEFFSRQLVEQVEQVTDAPAQAFTITTSEEVEQTAGELWSMLQLVGEEAKLITTYSKQEPMGPPFRTWITGQVGQLDWGAADALEQWTNLKDTLQVTREVLDMTTYEALDRQLDEALPDLITTAAAAIDPADPTAGGQLIDLIELLRSDYVAGMDEGVRQELLSNLRSRFQDHVVRSARISPDDPEAAGKVLDLLEILRTEYFADLLDTGMIADLTRQLRQTFREWTAAEVNAIRPSDPEAAGKIWDLWDLLGSDDFTGNLPPAVIEQMKAGLLTAWREWLVTQVDNIDLSAEDAPRQIINLHELLRSDYGDAAGETLAGELKDRLQRLLDQYFLDAAARIDPARTNALARILEYLDVARSGYLSEEAAAAVTGELKKKIDRYVRNRASALDPGSGFVEAIRSLELLKEQWWYGELVTPEVKIQVEDQQQRAIEQFWDQPRPSVAPEDLPWPDVHLTGDQWKLLFPLVPPAVEEPRGISTLGWAGIAAIPVAGGIAYLVLKDGGEEPSPELTARNDQLIIMCPEEGTINVLTNDTGEGLQVSGFTEPAAATLAYEGDGVFLIRNVTGASFSFVYSVTDRTGQTANAMVSVTVTLPAFSPVDDALEGQTDQPVSGNVLTNDVGVSLAVSSFTQPAGGTLSLETATGAFTFTPDPGFCGMASFSYSAEDPCGQTGSATVTIAFADTESPVITCPEDITIACDQAPDPSLTGSATATDNCDPGPDISYSDEISGEGCNQVVTRTWTATDEAGNVASCSQVIKRVDEIAPVITCPADLVLPCDADTDPANTGEPTVSDNCSANDEITLSYADAQTGNPCALTIERTWTAVDDCGNSSTCTQVLTLEDLQPPVITCPPDLTVSCGQQDVLDLTGLATATDACSPAVDISYTDDLSGFADCEGVIVREWTAVDGCGNTVICQQNITVEPAACDFTAEFAITPASCGFDNGALSISIVPDGNYQVDWSDGQTGIQANDLTGGLYEVSITDVNLSCTQIFQVQVEETPPEYIGSVSIEPALCMQSGDIALDLGSIGGNDFTVTLTGPVSVTVDNLPAGTVNLSDYAFLPVGEYTIEVVDASINLTCTDVTVVTVAYLPPFELSVVSVTMPSSPTATDGSVTLTATGGLTLPLDVLVNGVFQGQFDAATFIVTNLAAGTYDFLVIDAGGNGCESNHVVIDLTPPPLGPSFAWPLVSQVTDLPDWRDWHQASYGREPLADWLESRLVEHPAPEMRPVFSYTMGLPVMAGFRYQLPGNLQLRWSLGVTSGTARAVLDVPGLSAPVHLSSPFRHWTNDIGLRAYRGRQRWSPFAGMGWRWHRLETGDSQVSMGLQRTFLPDAFHRDRWKGFLTTGLRLNLSDRWYMELEGEWLHLSPWHQDLELRPQLGTEVRF